MRFILQSSFLTAWFSLTVHVQAQTGSTCPPLPKAKNAQEALEMEGSSNKQGCWQRDPKTGQLVFVNKAFPTHKPLGVPFPEDKRLDSATPVTRDPCALQQREVETLQQWIAYDRGAGNSNLTFNQSKLASANVALGKCRSDYQLLGRWLIFSTFGLKPYDVIFELTSHNTYIVRATVDRNQTEPVTQIGPNHFKITNSPTADNPYEVIFEMWIDSPGTMHGTEARICHPTARASCTTGYATVTGRRK